MNNIFFCSDNHYGHKNIILYASRPFSDVEEMNETFIENHNKTVKPNDTCYHLGDFSFMQEKETQAILRRLNGTNHLIYGNHDKMIMKNPNRFIGPNLFKSIKHYDLIKVNGQKIVLFHFGCRVWDGSHKNSFMLYGHSHGNLPPFGKSVDVGVDAKFITPEYRPVSLDEVAEFMKNQPFEKVDHHDE